MRPGLIFVSPLFALVYKSSAKAALFAKRRFARRSSRAAICLALILSLLFLPGTNDGFADVPRLATNLARMTSLPFLPLSPFHKKLFPTSTHQSQETTETRSNRVSQIVITPRKLIAYTGQQIS